MAPRVDDERYPKGLGEYRSAKGCRHRPGIAPGDPGHHLEGDPEVGDATGEGAGYRGQLGAYWRILRLKGRGVREAPERRFECSDAAALGWVAERSESVTP